MAKRNEDGFWYFSTEGITKEEFNKLIRVLHSRGFINREASDKLTHDYTTRVHLVRVNKRTTDSANDVGTTGRTCTYQGAREWNHGAGVEVDYRDFFSFNDG